MQTTVAASFPVKQRRLTKEGAQVLEKYFTINQRPSVKERANLLSQIKKIPGCEFYDDKKMGLWFHGRKYRASRNEKEAAARSANTSKQPSMSLSLCRPRSEAEAEGFNNLSKAALDQLRVLFNALPTPSQPVIASWAAIASASIEDVTNWVQVMQQQQQLHNSLSHLPTPALSTSPEPQSPSVKLDPALSPRISTHATLPSTSTQERLPPTPRQWISTTSGVESSPPPSSSLPLSLSYKGNTRAPAGIASLSAPVGTKHPSSDDSEDNVVPRKQRRILSDSTPRTPSSISIRPRSSASTSTSPPQRKQGSSTSLIAKPPRPRSLVTALSFSSKPVLPEIRLPSFNEPPASTSPPIPAATAAFSAAIATQSGSNCVPVEDLQPLNQSEPFSPPGPDPRSSLLEHISECLENVNMSQGDCADDKDPDNDTKTLSGTLPMTAEEWDAKFEPYLETMTAFLKQVEPSLLNDLGWDPSS